MLTFIRELWDSDAPGKFLISIYVVLVGVTSILIVQMWV